MWFVLLTVLVALVLVLLIALFIFEFVPHHDVVRSERIVEKLHFILAGIGIHKVRHDIIKYNAFRRPLNYFDSNLA